MTAAELLAEYGDHVFDEIDLDIEPDSLVGFATACGAPHPRFTAPSDGDIQGGPSDLAGLKSFHQ